MMKKRNIVFLTLLITLLLTFSTINLTADPDTKPTNTSEKLEVEKMVREIGGEWQNTITVEPGDRMQFRINVTYHNITAGDHWAFNINITDTLPITGDNLCIEYIKMIQGDDPLIWGDDNEKLTWQYPTGFHLMDGQTITLIFKAKANNCCENQLENRAKVTADEQCTGLTINGGDSAYVNIDCPEPDINVEKKVWDKYDNIWVENAFGKAEEDMRFNITVHNTGECTLTTVTVNDTLPDELEYNNQATPTNPTQNGQYLIWTFNNVLADEKIYIEFNVTIDENAIAGELFENTVKVTGETDQSCPDDVTDQDNAYVKVSGMLLEKQVWNEQHNQWDEETQAAVGDTVQFKIKITYYGDYTLYNIYIEDELPDCLEYANNANPEETEIDEQTIIWDLEESLANGETYTITFYADVTGFDPCEDCNCLNTVKVWAKECSGDNIYDEDTALIHVICEMTADAGGPYNGMVDEAVSITGDATNGIPPYTYEWDLDDDGEYDDATGKSITPTWDEPGTYTIWLKVTDDLDQTDTDYATVTITLENDAPNKPSLTGPASNLRPGQKYSYTVSATDPDDDQVYYYIDWGDGTNTGWLGPYNSSESITQKHSWSQQNTAYTIRAQAKDTHDAASPWKELPITTPYENNWFQQIIQKILEHFPILQTIISILTK